MSTFHKRFHKSECLGSRHASTFAARCAFVQTVFGILANLGSTYRLIPSDLTSWRMVFLCPCRYLDPVKTYVLEQGCRGIVEHSYKRIAESIRLNSCHLCVTTVHYFLLYAGLPLIHVPSYVSFSIEHLACLTS